MIQEVDHGKLWKFHLPRIGASASMISEAESALGFSFPGEYREFLSYADGWPSFYQSVDLFGCTEFIGAESVEYASGMLDLLDWDSLNLGVSRDEVFPIAATRSDVDVFVMGKVDSRAPGVVIWIAAEEVDRFSDYGQFYLAMVEYNRMEYKALAP